MGSRIDKIKQYLANLDATSNPARAIEKGFHVPSPFQPSWDLLAKRIEVDPARAHLVLGPIGSGKTTQLLRLAEQLNAGESVQAFYVDVSLPSKIVIGGGDPAITQKVLSSAPQVICAVLAQTIHSELDGKRLQVQEKGWRWVLDELAAFCLLAGSGKKTVFLLDALDRLPIADFGQHLASFRELKAHEFGLVVVGSVDLVLQDGSDVYDHFDRVERHPIVDVLQDEPGRRALVAMLRRRVDDGELLSDEVCDEIVLRSGGVLRDMFLLARGAIEEAWVTGAARVTSGHITEASLHLVDRMLSYAQQNLKRWELLQEALGAPPRALSSAELHGLAARNLLLERRRGAVRTFEVHPLLVDVIRRREVAE